MKPLPKGLPKTIKIGAIDVVVLNVDKIKDENDRDTEAVGCFSHSRNEISVIFDVPGKARAVTLLHEIMHALWAEYDLAEREHEERAVTTLSSGLAAVMRDNPKVFDWINGELIAEAA